MEKAKYEIIIASPPEYEELVAEIYHDGHFVALLSKEKGNENIEVEFANSMLDQSQVCRKMDLKEFLENVELARKKLVGECP
jgi:hypothetical protein